MVFRDTGKPFTNFRRVYSVLSVLGRGSVCDELTENAICDGESVILRRGPRHVWQPGRKPDRDGFRFTGPPSRRASLIRNGRRTTVRAS